MLAARAVYIGTPAFTETFPRKRDAVCRARRLTRLALKDWNLTDLSDSAVLICSELVTNSVEHARGNSLRLTVTRRFRYVRISVVDLSRTLPSTQRAGASSEHGRGLIIVGALASEWDTDPLPWGKRVWAHLDVP